MDGQVRKVEVSSKSLPRFITGADGNDPYSRRLLLKLVAELDCHSFQASDIPYCACLKHRDCRDFDASHLRFVLVGYSNFVLEESQAATIILRLNINNIYLIIILVIKQQIIKQGKHRLTTYIRGFCMTSSKLQIRRNFFLPIFVLFFFISHFSFYLDIIKAEACHCNSICIIAAISQQDVDIISFAFLYCGGKHNESQQVEEFGFGSSIIKTLKN